MQEPSMSTDSVDYQSDTGSDERLASQPARTKIEANFNVARPPPKSSLRLSAKLLLQIQQLAPNTRPVPVLEVWQPPLRKSKLTQDFHLRPKLKSGDLYATRDEPFIFSANLRKQSTKSDLTDSSDTHAVDKEIVAAICYPTAGEESTSVHFRDSECCWQTGAAAKPLEGNPCYRFTMRGEDNLDPSQPGRMILQWEKRDTAGKENAEEQFILFLIDRQARRKSRIATMSRVKLEIYVRKGSIIETLQLCLDLTKPSTRPGANAHERLETWLFTLVLTLGVWVSQQEGWL
ncbi:hypothetical protein N7468_006740 [Penicillium chermesinum]|uniref:Uncharacterized protein n=1 Tax=Penicillium chermesinum TaxID=63820 RepID=A0A9W9TLH5_9EURO|nr:uncharacterized protein N7468_006740 [Penicillium chermesinum]KAJ5225515.1 hypothetical protein N7468_006740 [Penicillium chermesinum]